MSARRHRAGAALLACLACVACAGGMPGDPPRLSPVADPTMDATGRRAVTLPMPDPADRRSSSNALWPAGARQFFTDPRAQRVGDIVTVLIQIDDRAQMANTSETSRESERQAGIQAFFGLETLPSRVLPGAFDPSRMIDTESSGSFQGQGRIQRNERVDLTLAALVVQVLDNGNLVVAGRQEIRVNDEVRELLVSGVVRPQDINAANQVRHEHLAEARVSYGGRGRASDAQRPAWGERVIQAVSPF